MKIIVKKMNEKNEKNKMINTKMLREKR